VNPGTRESLTPGGGRSTRCGRGSRRGAAHSWRRSLAARCPERQPIPKYGGAHVPLRFARTVDVLLGVTG
jgi:hypothetical protein